MSRRLILLVDVALVALVAYLAVTLHGAWTVPERAAAVPPAPASSTAAPENAAGPPAPRPALQTYAVVADKNLFNPTRVEASPEAPKPAPRTATPATPPPPKPRLYGIVVLPDGKSRAYLEDAQRKKVFGFSVGDSVAESKVEQIKNDRVVLRRGAEVYEVLLRDPTKPKPAAPPAAAAATNPFAAAAAAARGQPAGTPPADGQPATPPAPANPFRARPPAAGAAPAPGAPNAPGFNPFLQGAARRRAPAVNPAAPAAPAAPAPAAPEGQDEEEEESQ